MYVAPRTEPEKIEVVKAKSGISTVGMKGVTIRGGYAFREANWEIGRAPELEGIKVREWNRKDRWLAWRRKSDKIKRVAQLRDLKNRRKGKAKK